jgi:hypothetical protein
MLRKNSLVKVSKKTERFWVRVKKVYKHSFIGIVDNKVFNQKFKYKDKVRFLKKDIV